ncbi:MAG TPA: hypothetical protein QGH16_02460, partial [Verrucomicrobiota bacterium]|nr:hypothetical protein [Verrucomicrobiota bacterium]
MNTPNLSDFTDPARFEITPADRNLFETELAGFIPPNAFDAHAHCYDLRHLQVKADRSEIGHEAMLASMRRWMGEQAIAEGLYFGYPDPGIDCAAENEFVAGEFKAHPGCRGLMLIRPDDNPAETEA